MKLDDIEEPLYQLVCNEDEMGLILVQDYNGQVKAFCEGCGKVISLPCFGSGVNIEERSIIIRRWKEDKGITVYAGWEEV